VDELPLILEQLAPVVGAFWIDQTDQLAWNWTELQSSWREDELTED
jgi:hypothetical protein